MTDNCWIYNKECILEPIPGYAGFIYRITHYDKTTNRLKFYYGKKIFLHKKKSKLSKKARGKSRKRVQVKSVDYKWLNYWGSCKPLLEYIKIHGTSGFRREILYLCKNKSEMSFKETELLFKMDVLYRDDCWNSHIGHFYKTTVKSWM